MAQSVVSQEPAEWENTPEELAHTLELEFDDRARVALTAAGLSYGRDEDARAVWNRVYRDLSSLRISPERLTADEGIAAVRIIRDAQHNGVTIGPTWLGRAVLHGMCYAYAADDRRRPYGVSRSACYVLRSRLHDLTMDEFESLLTMAQWCLSYDGAPFRA